MLSNNPTTPNAPCLVNSNQVAHQLLIHGQGTMPTKPKRPILPPIQEGTPTMTHPFSEEEYKNGIAALKNIKAAGTDDVLVDQLKHLGQKTNMVTYNAQRMLHRKQDPQDMEIIQDYRHTQAMEILHDSEELQTTLPLMPYVQHLPTNYSKQNTPVVEQRLIKEQAGFRNGKSCTNQLLNLTQHIEGCYQRDMITGAAYVDISASYNTVNHKILI